MGLCGKMRYLITLILSMILYSQNTNFGGGPNMFYNNMYTAREVAMGGVGISSAEGYLANIWNPACMIHALDKVLEDKNDGELQDRYILGINAPFTDEYPGISFSLDNKYKASKSWSSAGFITKQILQESQKVIYIGGSIIYEDYGNLTETTINTNNEIEPVGVFNLSQSLLLFSIAGKFDDFSIGISGKYIHSDHIYGNSFSNRWGLDAGMVQSFNKGLPIFDKIKWGSVLRIDQDRNNRKIVFGIGPSFAKELNAINRLLISTDVITGDFMEPEFHLGVDLGFFKRALEIDKNTGRYVFLNSKGQKFYYDRFTGKAVITENTILEDKKSPIFNFYAGISANQLGIKSYNLGLGLNLPLGLKYDFVYSLYNKNFSYGQYSSIIDSALRVTLTISF